jgi:L-malate glycosyltransferase
VNRGASPKIALVAPAVEASDRQAWQARWLAEHLRRDGYPVSCVPMEPFFDRGNGWVARFLNTLLMECRYMPSLNRLAAADLVQVYSAPYWSFVLAPLPAIVRARRLGKPVVLCYDGREAADHLGQWGSWIHPWLKMVQEIVVPSRHLQTVFAGHGYRTRVIRNMIDKARFPYRPRIPLRPRLLSVGGLESHDGVEYTLVAFALIKTAFPDATLTIAGTGGQEGELEKLTRALGLDDVHFLGQVERHAMPTVYADADIFIHGASIDNQPLPLLEAMASGLPIVATGVGDIPDMLSDGFAGTLVPVADPGATAKSVTVLLEQPERASLMAHRAKQSVDRYTWSTVRPQWGQLYEDLWGGASIRDAA